MKRLYMIGGTMGVGKTAACRELQKLLDANVFLDGDWCWDMHPFTVNNETKAMVENNICFLLNSFLHCSSYENVIFCWVMHMQEIIDDIISRLDVNGCEVYPISLICSEDVLRERLERDVKSGIRDSDIIERSIARIPLYNELDTYKLNTDELTPSQTAHFISALFK